MNPLRSGWSRKGNRGSGLHPPTPCPRLGSGHAARYVQNSSRAADRRSGSS